MSRRARLPSPGPKRLAAFPAVAALFLVTSLTFAAPDLRAGAAVPETDRFPLCSTVFEVLPGGWMRSDPQVPGEFTLTAGLWAGAEADRGAGVEQLVSEALWALDFTMVPAGPSPTRFGSSVQAFADTSTAISPHEPLGLRVTQTAGTARHAIHGTLVRLRFVVQNISHEWNPPGWTLEHTYLALFADPDVGLGGAQPWMDDRTTFATTGGGDLAYAWDEPGGGDDTDANTGILLAGGAAHAVRMWGFLADPTSEAAKYALLRGLAHDQQTIDPPPANATDVRLLLSVGPFTIPPGGSQMLDAAIFCGLTPPAAFLAEERATRAVPLRVLVSPNPASASAGAVRFGGLPAGARVSIYEVSGRVVETLAASEAGEARWDFRRAATGAPAGVYLYRVVAAGRAKTGKVVLVR
jgi:hypothetical protein